MVTLVLVVAKRREARHHKRDMPLTSTAYLCCPSCGVWLQRVIDTTKGPVLRKDSTRRREGIEEGLGFLASSATPTNAASENPQTSRNLLGIGVSKCRHRSDQEHMKGRNHVHFGSRSSQLPRSH